MKDAIIIGAGQAGLSIGREMQKAGYDFLILDSAKEIGASWLKRWDSLKLFTPTEYNHLQDLEFPMENGAYPDKYQVADYFKKYVEHFNLPVVLSTLVQKVSKTDETFTLTTSNGIMQSKSVIIATGPFHTPFTPSFSKNISEDVLQIHSKHYLNPEQLQDGDTLVVGAGDSGVQILDEVSNSGRKTYFSGNTKISTIPQEFLGKTLWWWFKKTGFLTVNKYSLIGKKLSKTMQPIIGTNVKEILSRNNVEAVGRSLNSDGDSIQFEKKTVKGIKNIIWATGFKPNFSWIEGIQLDEEGYPKNFRGVSDMENLFFIGLPWMYTRGSATLGGVAKDSKYLIKQIEKTLIKSNNTQSSDIPTVEYENAV